MSISRISQGRTRAFWLILYSLVDLHSTKRLESITPIHQLLPFQILIFPYFFRSSGATSGLPASMKSLPVAKILQTTTRINESPKGMYSNIEIQVCACAMSPPEEYRCVQKPIATALGEPNHVCATRRHRATYRQVAGVSHEGRDSPQLTPSLSESRHLLR